MEDHVKNILMEPVIYSGRNQGIIEKMARFEPMVYDEICLLHSCGITGVVAGGFAAYILGLTNTYNDVDFFCESMDALKFLITTLKSRYDLLYEAEAGIVVNHKYCKLQVVCIQHLQLTGVKYYSEVIRSFDIPLCQKGFFLVHPKFVRNNAHITYTEATTHVIEHNYKSKANQDSRTKRRLKKYRQRVVKYGSPPALRSICQNIIQDRDPLYLPIRFKDGYLSLL